MSLIYITGNSGAGKSSVRKELQHRGYEAYDTDDDDITTWVNNATGNLVGRPEDESGRTKEWYDQHEWNMSRQKVKEFAERAQDKPIFLCGSPSNADDMLDLYDQVVCLVLDKETLQRRIASRIDHDFGKAPDELENILGWHDSFQDRYKDHGAVIVDAAQPLEQVVDEILTKTGVRKHTGPTMDYKNKTHFLRVFVDPSGRYGDLASVIIDEGRHIPDGERQQMTRELNTGETAFVNNLVKADISIMHPQGEIDFAGVAALGTAWLLTKLNHASIGVMKGHGGYITVSRDKDLTWVQASLETMPPWHHKQLKNAEVVEAIKLEDTVNMEHTMVWAWIDEAKGLIRARTFASDWDIPEAEGNGSGAMVQAAKLKRSIEIRHGKGSVIFAKPAPGGCADIGGRIIDVKGRDDSNDC